MSDLTRGSPTQIDAIADRFDHAWQVGQRPRIEDYLDEVPEPRHAPLLGELLRIELEVRGKAGERPTADEYFRRFPRYRGILDAVFDQVRSTAGDPMAQDRSGREQLRGAAGRSQSRGMKVTLTVTGGPHQGQVFEFREHDTFIVGRSQDAQFRLPIKDKTLSRIHFMIEVNPPCCRLMDMASTNGTLVNDRKVAIVNLHHGDVIKVGRTVIAIAIEPGASSAEIPITTLDVVAPQEVRLAEGVPAIPRYAIERELGAGGMGVVYLARGEADGQAVALKTVMPAMAGSPGVIARFLREASILRQLDHPNIVRFQEIGRADGRLFFVMDYVPGSNADDLRKRLGGTMPIGRAVDLACQTLDALTYAHDLGFVHRDMKPRNLLVATAAGRDRVKVADFGLARLYHGSPLSGLTLTGQVAGTFGFMAPEQITNFRESKPAVDQYAVGASLYHLLSGKRIYDFPPGVERQILMILQDEPVPIRSRHPDIPAALAAVIHRSLARDPTSRFPDARAMQAALAPFGWPRR
jgi:pSer/pThr/pTyr-binding forkhead associated (FHA) protein